jgi:hypothetical protein
MLDNLSPEEILKNKEIAGGVVYDDPIQNLPDEKIQHVEKEVVPEPTLSPGENAYTQPTKQHTAQPTPVQSNEYQRIEPGWKNLPVSILPSGGLFYPEGTQIAIRPAEVKEIRNYSTVDETDMLDLNTKLNMVLDACCRIKFPNEGLVDFRDLKQEDRFFVILAIRDLTFVKGENRIILTPNKKCNKNGCENQTPIELRTGVLSNYKIDPKIMRYYSREKNKFIFPLKKINKEVEMSVPSIGVMEAISRFVRNEIKNGGEVDESFIKIAPFYFENWRLLDNNYIRNSMVSLGSSWTKEEFSILFEMSELIKLGTELEVKIPCHVCGEGEVTAPITFPRGFRSLFVISDIFGELLRY